MKNINEPIILEHPSGKHRFRIEIITQKEPWFLDVNTHFRVNGKLHETSMISRGDLQDWVDYYLKRGFVIKS